MAEISETHTKNDGDSFKISIKQLESSNDVAPSATQPPDGGWGWIVVSVSFLTNFMAWGILLSSGVFLEELVEVRILLRILKCYIMDM